MTDSLTGKVAVVTGTGGGIGRAIAQSLAAEGAAVLCSGMNEAGSKETCALIDAAGGRSAFIRNDIRLAADNDAMIADAVDRFGSVDIVVNNAGLTLRGRLHETSEEDWDDVIATNLKGVYFSSRAVLPHFLRQGSGNLVFVSSSFGILAAPGYAAYCASKAALIVLAKQMALDYGPEIRVNCVCPGATNAPQVRRYIESSDDPQALEAEIGAVNAAMGRMAEPDEIADAVTFLASPASRFVTGHALVVDGGQTIDA